MNIKNNNLENQNFNQNFQEMSKISIITLNYNGVDWLQKCLDSLVWQTYPNLEIIVVDNKSTDKSIEFLQKYRDDQIQNQTDNSRKIKLIESSQNLGFAGGNNLGIEAAAGEFICLFNVDAWMDKNLMSDLLESLHQKKVDVIAPVNADYEGKCVQHNEYPRTMDFLGHPVFAKMGQKEDFSLPGSCMLFTKKFYLETQGLDSNFFMYFEETDWFWRINLLNKKFYLDRNLKINHFGSAIAGQGVNYNKFLWRNQNTLQMLLKNYYWHNLCWIIPIYLCQNLIEIFFFLILLQPKIAFSYVQGWFFNLQNWSKIMEKRQWVQKNRILSDKQILAKICFTLAKVQHLSHFLTEFFKKK